MSHNACRWARYNIHGTHAGGALGTAAPTKMWMYMKVRTITHCTLLEPSHDGTESIYSRPHSAFLFHLPEKRRVDLVSKIQSSSSSSLLSKENTVAPMGP